MMKLGMGAEEARKRFLLPSVTRMRKMQDRIDLLERILNEHHIEYPVDADMIDVPLQALPKPESSSGSLQSSHKTPTTEDPS